MEKQFLTFISGVTVDGIFDDNDIFGKVIVPVKECDEIYWDKFEGHIRLVKVEGNQALCRYIQGISVKFWSIYYFKYEGNFEKSLLDGQGKFTTDCPYSTGHGELVKIPGEFDCIGRFKHGKMNGFVTQTFANGHIYEGGFVNGKVSGCGLWRYPDGTIKTVKHPVIESNGVDDIEFFNVEKLMKNWWGVGDENRDNVKGPKRD